nr:microtubule-associated protein futsch isoform X4 [Populus alba]
METEGLETVHTSLGGNAVVPEGGSFLEPPSIATVPGEEILRKLMDQVPCLVEKNEKQAHRDEGFDTTEEGETKEIAEKEKQVDDVTGTILQIDKIEGASVNIEEEEKIVKHVEAMEDGEADVEGKPKSIEKETGGPEKYEEGEMKIEESVELETSNEVGSFEPGLSQGKEALSQTADAIVNNLDNPETVKEVCQEKEIKDSGTGDGTINEQRIGEERKEEEKSGICSSFLDDKGTDVVKAIETTEKEKEGTTCDTIGGGTYIVEAGIDIQKEKETTPGTGEGMQDKRNTEDIATATHKTQETEEMYSQQVDKPDVCMVSESESEEIVNKSPQGEGQNLILEKTAEVDSSEGENIKDGMDPEQKPDGLFVKHEENKQSMHQDLAMAEESTEENRDMETPTVIAAENNTSDTVPIPITTAQDHSVIEDDKIMDVVANAVPEDSKEEMSKYEDKIKETFAQQDEAVSEKSENSLALISGEIDTATSSECSEAIGSAKEETPIKIPGESFEDKKEEKPIDADAVAPIEKSLLPTDLNEKIEDAGLELQYKNSSEVPICHSLEQETIPVQDEKQPKVSDFEPQEQDHEENGPSKDLEKHAEDDFEACESMQNTNLENPSAEGAKTTEVNSKANEMAVEKEEKIHELESEEKLAIDDAGTNLEEEKQKKEEAHDEQTYQMATSDRIEEVTSDEVCSREFVDKKIERSVQAAGFQEAETPLKNGVGENYEMSSIVNEEVIDEPKITDIGEVIDEERIKDNATHPSSELVFDEKLVESSQDNETEAEMSKGDGVEEQMMKDDNAKVILQESIQEASVNDFQNDLKDAEKSGREMSEVSEAEKKDETNNNDESPDSTLQASLLKEQESLQTENLTAETEEKDEDGSSIRKDEDKDNDNGLKEFKECSEKETLKGEEDVEQISPKNELGENLESSASMIFAETEEVALNKTTQETEEEMDEGVEGVKKEIETGKEDGEEQVIEENDAKSIPIESIKEVIVSKLLDDENNAEEFIREISEESVAAGTNESITDATYQNDGSTPDAALETSTAKETLKDEEDVEQIPPKNEPGENLERSASMLPAETEEVALNKTTWKTEEEMDDGVEGVKKEAETRKEDGEEQVIDENNAKSIPVESIKEVPVSKLLNDENNAEEFKKEIYEESVAAGTNENITDATCQNDGTTPDATPETSTVKETLKDEEDVEQIPPENEPGENLERSASMIPAETEEVALNKTTRKTEEEIDEGVEGIKKEAETGKEDGKEQVIDENNAKSIPVESIKEVPVSKLLNDENNAEEFKKEQIYEESVVAGTNENITDATYQNDGTTPDAAPETSTTKETLKDEEDVEQISPKNEPGENLESLAGMIPAKTEEVTLNKTTQKTEEEIEEGVESIKKEAETGKEDGEDQVIDENDAKSILVESIKDVPVSKLLNDENNAEAFKREIFEESVAAGTNDSITDETNKNDGTPNAALETSTVKQVEIVQGEGKDTIPAEASPKEEEEHDRARGFKRVGDNSSEIRLEEDLEKSEEETSKKIDAVAHETNQHIEFPSSTLETSPVQEQASVQRDNLTPEETSPEEKIYEDGSSNKKDEDKEKNTGLAEETRNAGETLKAEESLEQILQNDNLIENPKQSINMICAETEADAFSKMVDNHEEAIVEIPQGNAEAELLKEENIEVHVVEESNINSLSQESAEESPIKDFQNAAKNSEKSTEEMLESQIAGGDETNTNDEDCNSSLPISVDKIDESFEGEDKNITTAEASTHDEKEEHGSLDRADDGNDSNRDLTVTNQDSAREALKVQEDFEKELQRIELGEPEESSTVMAAETEAGTLSDKIDDVTSQEEVVTIQNIEETVEKEKKEEHGSLEKAGEGNDSNPDLTVTNQDSAREASKVQEDSQQELLRIEPGELEESSTVMAAETEAGTLSDKIDDVTSQEEVVTVPNIEETVEKEKKEEHGSLDKAGEGNDSNPDLTVTNQDSAREASKVQEDSEQELQRIEPGEPEESSTVMAAETEAGTLSDKIDDVTSQEEVVTIQNIEETVEKEKKEEHGPLDRADDGNDSNPDLTVTNQDSAREASKVQEDSEQELQRIEPGEPEESSTVMAAETEAGTLSDKIDDITSQEQVVTIQNIEETIEKEKKEEHGPLDKAGEGNDSNPDLTVTNQDSAREASKVQEDSQQELQRIEPGEPEESSTVMAAETKAGTLSDKIDDVTSQEEVATIQNIEETVEKEKKEEHGPLDRADDGNDSNPDLTVTNLDSAREASKVQEDSEQELPRIEPGELEESSTVRAAQTETGTLSDKIDDVTSQEEVVTVPNIEETEEKEKKEEHGSLDKAGEGNDSNPDLTVTNQDSVREASKVQEDSEQELQRIEPGELEESSTVMAAETEAGTLSDKIDDVTSQEEVVTIENIEETVEKEKKEEHGPLDRADDGNDSNPDLTVTDLDSAREASKVQEDSEQELQRIEPGEPAESSTVMAAETEAGALSDKIDDVTSQEEVVTVPNIEETIEKEKKEGSEDIDVTKVKRAVMEEDLKLVAEASDANKSVENDAEDENIISGGKEVETVEKKFELDSIQKLEVEEKRENKEEEAKNEDIKEVCGDTKPASLSVDAEEHVTTEEHTNTDISPQTTGETTAEEKAETVKEMEESVITSVDEDAEKKVPEEESAINDQSRIIYKGDESGMLVEQEVHEIIQTAEEYGDIGKQGSVIKDSYEAPLSSTDEEIPLHKETEDESDKVKPNEEVKDSKSEFTEPCEARGSVDRQEFETLRGEQGPNSDICLVKASEGVSEKESNKSPVEISYLESESKGEILEEVQPDVNDSSSALTTGIARETSFKEAEPEDKRQIESFEPAPQEKGPVTESTERTTLESVDIDAKPEDSNFIENEDHGIPAASEAEELKNEMHEETPITGSEDYKEETTNETSLDNVLDDKQVECSTILPKEPELMANEGNKATDENSTTYENIETPQTPQEIEIMLKEDMAINARDASKSVDPRIESIKEEVGSYQFDNLNEHRELDNEKQEGIDISKSSEVRDLANQGEICKLMSLEDEYSSNVGDEALKCFEVTSAERKEAVLEEDNSTKKYEDSLTDNVEANKAAFELEEGTNNQEQAIGTKDYGVLAEENFEVSESGKKLEGVSESETGDQSSQKIPETDPGKVENITEIQDRSLKSAEQSSLESQEVREETGEKTEPRFETEGDVKETQNTDETVKDVLLTEEVDQKVDKAGSETPKCTEKDVNDTLELCAKSTEDERVHEVKQSSLIAEECQEATESNEQTAIMSSDLQEAPTMEEMSLAKAINDEDNEMPAVLSTTKTAEESDEMIKIIKEEDSCCDKIKATTMVEIAKTSLEEAQLDEKPVQVSNITSNDAVSLEIEAEACQQEKIKDNVGLELPSNLASPNPIDDHENIMREQVAKENADADDVQENERASDVVYESKDHGIEELVTSKIKEENEKSSEIESLGVEAAANEIAIDQNPPEVLSKEEQGISATTERREENVKDVELLEDDLRKTEEVPLQMDDCRERDISQLELQSNKDTQNQSPKEVLEEECGTPDETKEEIKEGPKLVSMTSSQGFEALKEDESTSGRTVPEEKLEEQNQTPAAALLSKEEDCGTERIIENIEECVQVEIPTDPRNDSPKKITEDTRLHKEETNELEVSGFGFELNTGMQKDSLNEVQVEESKSPDDASKLQTPDYETSKEAFESMSEAHGHKGFTASQETEIEEKHPEVAITDLTAGEDRSEKIIDPAEIIHDEVIEEGTFERTSNLRTELSKEAFKSISEVHGHEALAESEDTEIKEKHPEVTVTDMAAEENQSERTIDATEIIHDKLKSEEIMEEKEGAKNGDPGNLGEETTKECQEEYELKAEEGLGDEGTQKDIQNEELYKEAEKADGIEKQMDTERIIEHLHLAAAENETMKESFLDEAGSELHLENQICEIASGNDGRTEAANVKEEEMDVEISQKEVPTDLVEANEATRDIHEEEETSKTTTEHIEEHVKEVVIEADEHPSAPKTTESTCSQKEETKDQEVCGSGVECSTDMQKNGSNEFDEEEGRTPDEDSTLQPQGYENKIKDKEYLPESNKMTEITETGAFEKTSDLRAETGEEAFKSVSEVHEHEVLAESEHPEIKKEKHTEVAVTDLVAGENQNKKTIAATEVVHDELTNEDEELTKQDKQQFKEEKEDTKNCNPIHLGEETTKESRQIHDLKAEESQEDKMETEIQNEEVSNESGEYHHLTAVENETINESFPDEALVENAEDMGTKLQVEKHSDEKTSGYDRTEAITNEEFGTEISEKESLQAPAEANETSQDIHQGERDSDSTSEKPIPIEAEPQETTERKKDAPQVLLQEPIVEATQGAGVGESEPGKATGIADVQGFEHKAERSIDEENIRGNDESMSAKTSLFDMMQSSTRERQVGGDVTEETRVEGEKAKSDEEKEDEEEEEEEGEEHKKTDSGSDAPVMVEASRDIVDVKVASKKHYNILSGVGSKVKNSISKVKKAITGKSSHPKQHSPK